MPQRCDGARWGVFTPQDLDAMRSAFLIASAGNGSFGMREEAELLGRSIIRLYNTGLVEPEKLAAAATLMTSSKLFRSSEPQ